MLRHLIILLPLMLAACSEPTPQIVNGAPAVPFTLATLDGGSARFPADFDGQVVALRFWADWCPFCESEMRALEPVFQRHRDAGLNVLAVNVRQDPATAAAFIARLGTSYPVLLDREGAVAKAYGVLGLPTTFLIDRTGSVRGRILGESTPEAFEQMLQGLLD